LDAVRRAAPRCYVCNEFARIAGFAVPPQIRDVVGALSRAETMMTRLAPVVLAAGLVLAGVAFAQDDSPSAPPPSLAPSLVLPPGADDGRYTFHRVEDSFVRLDGRTGQVSACAREIAGWTCRAMPDERTALEDTIGRLQGDNAALKKELLARGLSLPNGVKTDPPAAKQSDKGAGKPADPNPSVKTPTDAELDRMMAFIEKVWRRLVEMMVDFQRDMQRKS
jgi:hypothetical protein